MKNLIKYLIVAIVTVLTFTSCEKEPSLHKLKFELVFSEEPNNGNSNLIDVTCEPYYLEDGPQISSALIDPGYTWTYEYWGLEHGDEVTFIVSPQLSYRFVMNIYVDDILVSSRSIVTSDDTYFATITESQFGLNNEETTNYPIIKFNYYESQ